MEKLLNKLQRNFPNISFTLGKRLYWSPQTNSIFYTDSADKNNQLSLLHEVGHALLEHKKYSSDVDLLQKEVSAWAVARKLASDYHVSVDEAHIDACLDSYRDWLHKRSACPSCASHGVESPACVYICLNCSTGWQVSSERFCRPYRRLSSQKQIAG